VGVFGLQAIKDWLCGNCGAASFAGSHIRAQCLQLQRLQALGIFKQPQPGTHYFTDVVIATACDLIPDEGFEMRTQCNAGGHANLLIDNNYY